MGHDEDHEVGTQKTDGLAPLGNRGSSLPIEVGGQPGGLLVPSSPSAERWELLRIARSITTRKSLRCCGMHSHDGRVSLSVENGRVSVSGLLTCSSKICPVCFARTTAQQVATIEAAATRFLSEPNHSAIFLTLTIPHTRNDELPKLLSALQKGWVAAFSGGRARLMWNQYGLKHYVRALDYTHSEQNGHHPHFHVLILLDRAPSEQELFYLECDLRERWARSVKRSLDRDMVRAGIKLEAVRDENKGLTSVIRYVGKIKGPLLEATWSQGKTGSGRTIWAILAGAKTSQKDKYLWRYLEKSFYKKRWLVMSRNLVDLAEMEDEEGDQAEADQAEKIPLTVLSESLWRAINQKGLIKTFLSVAENHSKLPEHWNYWRSLCDLSLDYPFLDWWAWLPERPKNTS